MSQPEQKKDDRPEVQQASPGRPLDIPPGAYARTGTSPAHAASGFAGPSYQPAPYMSGRPGERTNDKGSMLTIGRGISMSGEIEACDYLVVEGSVEAALKGARVLEVEETGVFYGTVEIEEATIAGRFEGDITVRGRLTIRTSGTITGSIAYGELEVEAGATIDGRMTPVKALQGGAAGQGAGSAKGSRPTAPARPREAGKAARTEQGAPSAANSDGELFSSSKSAAE